MSQATTQGGASQFGRTSGNLQAAVSGLMYLALLLPATSVLSAVEIPLPSVTVGENLEVPISLKLPAPAPTAETKIKLTSEDPKRLLFSLKPELAGTAEITVSIQAGNTGSPEFFVHGLGKTGTVSYSASAPGLEKGKGTVTLVPSAIVIAGPAKFGNPLVTTSGGLPSKLTLYSAQLDAAGKFVAVQQVRGGFSVPIRISNSDPSVGTVINPALTIEGGNYTAVTQLKPSHAGATTITVEVPPGFSAPSQYATVVARVNAPALSLPDQMIIGHNLELGAHVNSGELVSGSGLQVVITSGDPAKLLLSTEATQPGSKSITVTIPAGGFTASYFLHALGDSGTVSYSASAPGFQARQANVILAPSGVIITGPTGTPDEAEYLRPNAPLGVNGFFTKKGQPVPVVLYSAYLDPVTHRCADITVQPLRAGVSLRADVRNEDPSIGTLESTVTIQGGSAQGYAKFVPLRTGSTVLSVSTPAGFTTPTNATTLKAVVTD